MTFKFIHAADLHIDSPLRGLERYEEAPVAEIRQATRQAFERLVRRALELEVDFVILAGDVFDGSWKDFGTGLWFSARLRELTRQGIRVYLLAGNHDAESRMTTSLPYPEGVYRFATRAPQSFVDEPTGVLLHGQGYAKAATTEDLALGYPQASPGALNIGVLHTCLGGREGHLDYAATTPATLRAKGYDYWALGHVHEREVVSEEPWIVFPGNLQGRHVRECGAKGATVVTVTEGRIEAVEAEAFDVLRFARLEVDVSPHATRGACEDAVVAALTRAREEADGRLLAARVRVAGRSAAHGRLLRERDAFVAACRERASALGGVWLEKVLLDTRDTATSDGRDLLEALELDSPELRADALRAASEDVDALLSKLLPGIDLAREELNLRDDRTLAGLLDSARDEILRRLVDVDGAAREETAP